MMKVILSIIFIAICILLQGCESIIVSEVSLKDLAESDSKELAGELYVKIPSCSDFNDSRKPSKSLINAKDYVSQIFPEAEFIECFSKEFNTYARFSILLYLDKNKNGVPDSESSINLVSNEAITLGLVIPKNIRDRISLLKKKYILAKQMQLKVRLTIKNDTADEQTITIISAYIDNAPCVLNEVTINRNSLTTISLSDVSVSSALQNDFVTIISP